MICVKQDHYPTDRPLSFLTIDARLHFPEADQVECEMGSICASCTGSGETPAIVCGGGHATRMMLPCGDCRGTGAITEARRDALDAGNALRAARIERGETLGEAARNMGLTPAQLSHRERGDA